MPTDATDAIAAFAEACKPHPSRMVRYTFPLREERDIHLDLPADLQPAEVERLHRFLQALPIDPDDCVGEDNFPTRSVLISDYCDLAENHDDLKRECDMLKTALEAAQKSKAPPEFWPKAEDWMKAADRGELIQQNERLSEEIGALRGRVDELTKERTALKTAPRKAPPALSPTAAKADAPIAQTEVDEPVPPAAAPAPLPSDDALPAQVAQTVPDLATAPAVDACPQAIEIPKADPPALRKISKPAPLARISCKDRTDEERARNAEIKVLRIGRGWSQSTLGAKVGVNQNLISLIETNAAGATQELLEQVRTAVAIAQPKIVPVTPRFRPKRPSGQTKTFETMLAENPALADKIKHVSVTVSDPPVAPSPVYPTNR